VVILGAGFAGAATAWALARRGARAIRTIVLEREVSPGRFASGRSAGLGRQLAEDDATTALTVRGAAILRDELAAAWRPCGGILSFDQTVALDDYVARAARFGVPVERLDAAGVAARWPGAEALAIAGALHIPSDGVIDIAVLLGALLRDARIVCEAPAQAIVPAPSGGGVRVVTRRGTVEARVVVDATGAWAGEVTGDPPLTAFKRHIYVLKAGVAPASPFLWHLGAGEVYVRGDGGALMISPCDASITAPADQQPDATGDAALRARLAGSAWRDAPVIRGWACQRAFTPDRTMRLGRDPARPWLVWAAGLGGHGATAAPAVGERVADACLAALAAVT